MRSGTVEAALDGGHYLVRFDDLVGFTDGSKWPESLAVVALSDMVMAGTVETINRRRGGSSTTKSNAPNTTHGRTNLYRTGSPVSFRCDPINPRRNNGDHQSDLNSRSFGRIANIISNVADRFLALGGKNGAVYAAESISSGKGDPMI